MSRDPNREFTWLTYRQTLMQKWLGHGFRDARAARPYRAAYEIASRREQLAYESGRLLATAAPGLDRIKDGRHVTDAAIAAVGANIEAGWPSMAIRFRK